MSESPCNVTREQVGRGVHPYLQAQLVRQLDAVTGTFKFRLGEEVRHKKSGGVYIIVGLPNEYVLEHSREPAYLYLMKDGRTCVRSQAEMEDGRFESVPEGTAAREFAAVAVETKCKPGGCSSIGCEGGHYCFNPDGTKKQGFDRDALAAALPFLAPSAKD